MKNPLFQSKSPTRVIRSGSWRDSARYARVSYRNRNFTSVRFNDLGFRLFRSKEKS